MDHPDRNDPQIDAPADPPRMNKIDLDYLVRFITQKIDGLEKRLDGIEKRLDGIEKRLDGIEKRLDGIEKRFNNMEIE